MSASFAPEQLDCPDPSGCPVAVDALTSLAQEGRLPVHTIPAASRWSRVYDALFGYADPNPGYGDARFSPFDDRTTGGRVPTVSLARSPQAALLETVLRDTADWGVREVEERRFIGMLHAQLQAEESITVADLRDGELAAHDLERTEFASSPQEHYPCTRSVAKAIHTSSQRVQGILWHSRQAEMNGTPAAEVLVLFSVRLPDAGRALTLVPSIRSSGALGEGTGRIWLDELLEDLGISVIPEDD